MLHIFQDQLHGLKEVHEVVIPTQIRAITSAVPTLFQGKIVEDSLSLLMGGVGSIFHDWLGLFIC